MTTFHRRILWSQLTLLAACMIWTIATAPDKLPLPEKENGHLRVGVANLLAYSSDTAALTDNLVDTAADIIVLLEWTGHNVYLDTLREAGYRMIVDEPRHGTHGICVLAKSNLDCSGSIVGSPAGGPCQFPVANTRVRVGDQDFAVIGFHAPPPLPQCDFTTNQTVEALAAWFAEGRLTRDVGVCQEGDLAVIAGDFNSFSFWEGIERITASGFQDCYRAARGKPLAPTWAPNIVPFELFRIDYVFAPDELEIAQAWVVDLPGSDHQAVVADIALSL